MFSIVFDLVVSPFPDRIKYRNFKKFNNITFRADLKRENWELVLNSNDFNMSLSRFLHLFNGASNKHAPLEILSIRNKSFKRWITSGLRKSMKTRDKYMKSHGPEGKLGKNFTRIFKVFTRLPESRSDEGNLENFENKSKINP